MNKTDNGVEDKWGCLRTILIWAVILVPIFIYLEITASTNKEITPRHIFALTSTPYSINSDSSSKATRNAELENFGATEVYYDNLCKSDPCCSLASGTPSAYSGFVCGDLGSTPSKNSVVSSSGCPSGCTFHKDGCDIKGNIGYNTGEKIYHLPGMTFYNDTVINPDYGERWFCTEAEAKANGWRKASN